MCASSAPSSVSICWARSSSPRARCTRPSSEASSAISRDDDQPADRRVGLAGGEHEQRQPRRARERLARRRGVGGQLGGPRELAGGAGERAGLLAFERERPSGEDAGAFAGGVRDRGGVAAGGAELLADALELHRAAVPDQRALLELGLPLGRRPRLAGVGDLHSATALPPGVLVLAPAAPQRGERQVAGEPAAAVPHAPPRTFVGAGEPDGVADDDVGAALGVAGAAAGRLPREAGG